MDTKRQVSIVSLYKGLVLYFVFGGVLGCPSINVTLNQVLEGNPHLEEIHQQFKGPAGFLSDEGMKTLLLKLFLKTVCSSQATAQINDQNKDLNYMDSDHDDIDRSIADHDLGTDHERITDDHDQNIEDNEPITDDHNRNINDHDRNIDDHDREDLRDRRNNENEHDDHEKIIRRDNHNDVDKMNERMIDPGIDQYHLKKGESEKNMDSHLSKDDSSATHKTKDCDRLEDVLARLISKESSVSTPESFLLLCPAILDSLLRPLCPILPEELENMELLASDHDHDHDHDHHEHDLEIDHHHHHAASGDAHMTKDAWIAAIVSMILIGLIAMMCILVIPVLKRSRFYVLINNFLLALAVGSLAGDALIHLIPHAMSMNVNLGLSDHLVHALCGFTAFVGILLFLLMEKLHNLIGHKHSHGHGHDGQSSAGDDDELIKEIGVISSELNIDPSQNFSKIGEKLSQHSKHTSFIFTDGNTPSDATRGCFESCPPHLKSTLEDPNGNNGNVDSMVVCKPRAVDHVSASDAECERLVNNSLQAKMDQVNHLKSSMTAIPPPPLMQNSPPKALVRQDSKNFNMVLQEYHVGHHGHSHHGHSHVTGKKDSLRTMILLGDGMHTFMDGMAIGAAFGTSLTGGIATAVAVLCHELPHKVGDFAILFEMGMRRRQAVKMVIVLWLLSVVGLALGVTIGSIEQVSPWIYCFTAGVFLYLALVDLLSELSIDNSVACSSGGQMALQVAGMLTGAGIMLVIAIYEHDLQELLERFL